MMNGLRTWVLHDLPHVLPSRSVQAPPANHVHTSTTRRRFWNIFDFGRKHTAAKKCPPPKNMVRASMEPGTMSVIPAARRTVLKAKSMTRVEMHRHVPKTKLFASPNMIVNVTSFTKKEDYTSLLDGNPVPMNMKLKLKGYRTLRTQKCEDFAFVPGGTTCELDIIPPRAFDGWKARESVDASKSVPKLSVAEAPAEKPIASSAEPTATLTNGKTAAPVDVPSYPPTFESIAAIPEEVKAVAPEQNPVIAKPETSDLTPTVNPTLESMTKPKAECEATAENKTSANLQPEAEPKTEPGTTLERMEATSEKKATLNSQPAADSTAKSLAQTTENASVEKTVPENFLKTSKKPLKSPTDSRGENSSLSKLSLETQALGDERPKKFELPLAEETVGKELGLEGFQSLMNLKNESAVPYFAPVPRRKASFAITHSQLIIHDHPPSAKFAYSSAPSYASSAKSGTENMTFAPTKNISKMAGMSKTASFSSMGCSNVPAGKSFNAGGPSNAGGFGNNGNRGQNLYPPPIPKRTTTTKQHNPDRLQQAVRMKSTDSAGLLKKVENTMKVENTTMTGNLKDSRMPSFKSWPDSGATTVQAQSYSCRRNRCREERRKCRRRCCDEEEEEEMIPPRTICTKVREEKKERRRPCKRQRSCERQQRSCERTCQRRQKPCKRYCCPALRRRPDCNFEKEKCPKDKCQQQQTCHQRERKCGYGGVPRVPVKRTKPDKTCMEDSKCHRRQPSCGRRRRQCRQECERDDCNRRRSSRSGGRGCNRRMSSLAGSQALLAPRNDNLEVANEKIINRTFAEVRHGMSENLRTERSATRPRARTRERVDLEHGKSVSSYSVRGRSGGGGCSASQERFSSNVILNRTYSQLKSVDNVRRPSIVTLARPYSQLANDKNALLARTRCQPRLRSAERTFVVSGDGRSAGLKSGRGGGESRPIGGKRMYGSQESDDDNVKFFMKNREKPPPKCQKEDDRCGKSRKKAAPGPKCGESKCGKKESSCEKLRGSCGKKESSCEKLRGSCGKKESSCEKLQGSCGKKPARKCKTEQRTKSESCCVGKTKDKGQAETSAQRLKREHEEMKECKKQLRGKCDTGKKCGKGSKTKFDSLGVDNLIGERLKKYIKSVNSSNVGITATGRRTISLSILSVARSISTVKQSANKKLTSRADNREYDVEELPILVEVEPTEVTEDPPQSTYRKRSVQRKPTKLKP